MLIMTPEVLRACSYPISEAASGENSTSYMTFPSLVVSTKRVEIRCKVYETFDPLCSSTRLIHAILFLPNSDKHFSKKR